MTRMCVVLVLTALVVVLGAVEPSSTLASSEVHGGVSGLAAVFAPNVGQAHPSVLFEGGVLGRLVSVTADSIVFAGGERLEFVASSASRVRGVERAARVNNYFLGNDESRWRTGVPTYRAVRFENLYSGVDLEVKIDGGLLVADLQPVTESALDLVSWQLVDDSGTVLESSESRSGGRVTDHTVHLTLGADGAVARADGQTHDSSIAAEVTVDYATYLGGGRDDSAAAVAVDGEGAAYVVGTTHSSNFPTKNAYQEDIASGSLADSFVAKINPAGTELVYSTYLGGNREDFARDIAVDNVGHAYVVGYTASRDFPTNSALEEDYGGGDWDGFVSVFSRDGSQLQYGSFLGGRDADYAQGIGLGSAGPTMGQLFIVGSTKSTDFPQKNAYQTRLAGSEDAFLSVVAAGRTEYVYSTFLGGATVDSASGVAVDAAGAAYVTGYTDSARFPTKNPIQGNVKGSFDAFVTKLTVDGSDLAFSTYLGGRDNDEAQSIAVHGEQAVIAGYTDSNNFPRENAYQGQLKGGTDGFVSRISDDGTALVFSTFIGGTGSDQLFDVAVDGAGNAHAVGSSDSANFPTKDPVQSRISGPSDAVVASLSADGQDLLFGTYFGGSRVDSGYGVAVDTLGRLPIAGFTMSADLQTAGGIQDDFAGQGDAYVARFVWGDVPTPVVSPTASMTPTPFTPTVTTTPTLTLIPSNTPTDTPVTPTNTPTATEEPPEPSIYLPYVLKP